MIRIALILPKDGVVLDLQKGEHLYFLGGPIRGAGDWQAKAIRMLTEKDPACYIACPCRYYEGIKNSHELYQYHLPATKLPSETDDIREFPEYVLEFPNQTMWERYYLDMASLWGSIIFWLPCEDQENPRQKDDGPYAQDTYGELGRWSIRSSHNINPYTRGQHSHLVKSSESSCMITDEQFRQKIRLVVGAEKNFPGLKVIQKNFDADHKGKYPIYDSLEKTIDQAIVLANQI
jgi:hypothetical protein